MADERHFELCVPTTAERVHLGSNITIPCHLSPKISGADLKIRWYKETDFVCIYKNRQVTEGIKYENRVSLSTEELNKGVVALQLQNFSLSDVGDYLCRVTSGDIKKEITVRVEKGNAEFYMRVAAGALAAGAVLIPGIGLAAAAAGAAAAITAGGLAVTVAAAGGAEAAAAAVVDITFKSIDRKWSEKERHNMEKSSWLTDTKSSIAEKDRMIKDLEMKRKELQEKMYEKDMRLDKMSKLISEKESELKKTVTEMEACKYELTTLKAENRQLQEEIERIKRKSAVGVRRNSISVIPPSMSGETSNADSSVLVSGSELRLVLLGSAGSEMSASVNIILNREEKIQTDTSTEIQQSESRQGEVNGKQVTVVETPDWFCSGLSLEEVREDVRLCVRLSAPGPHVFLLVIPVQQSTGVERAMLEKMEEIFGEKCWRNSMILFTVTDEEQKKIIGGFVQSGNQEVQRLVEKCGNRFHCLNIHQSGDDSQISELLEKIEKMVEGNTERFYSSEIYLEIRHLREREKFNVLQIFHKFQEALSSIE